MDISVAEVAIVLVAAFVGSVVQASIGIGLNLVTAPVLALVEPRALPATVVLLALPLVVLMVGHEHTHVDREGLAWMMVGRVPGTVLGTLVVGALAPETLAVVVGASVLLAVAASAATRDLPHRPSTWIGAGLASGTSGTAAGIGGPPLAVLYQHHQGPVIRSTLAAVFLLGTALSGAALAMAGEVRADHVGLALVLTPAVVAGTLLSRPLTRYLDRRWLRPAILTFAAVSAVVVIADGLT